MTVKGKLQNKHHFVHIAHLQDSESMQARLFPLGIYSFHNATEM